MQVIHTIKKTKSSSCVLLVPALEKLKWEGPLSLGVQLQSTGQHSKTYIKTTTKTQNKTKRTKLDVIAHIFNPSLWEAEGDGST